MRLGFTLVELLIVLIFLGIFITFSYSPVASTYKKAHLLAGQSYVRNVALALEAQRDPSTGALPTHLTDCLSGFGQRPSTVKECTITYLDSQDYVIEASLEGADLKKVIYKSSDGTLVSLP
ncbi:prepilin-type N-terminal cleavage/methylation domain-containing protein [Thermus arciformis]|uniref:Prepilin-type N-terminal cleavage/methylation domain-containing protein n=1 Tax=Thermus arciformis TaxID=482827 RepID=A0A1G7HAL8_9DEIN|nr:prepilin-type N-terminal cleavage/methylation domain-containing protein [Thermus arciformis]SDE97344.1 prepilin-type N-terminal cleavage/methylation domain-containing protein [Thermus arciformis]